MKIELPEEIQDKLEEAFNLINKLDQTKDEIEEFFNEVLLYDIDHGENYDLYESINEIYDGRAGHYGDGIDEAIGVVMENYELCEFKEGEKNSV
jgi:hypothetical protein